jgi:two-component sensor histidine kinase
LEVELERVSELETPRSRSRDLGASACFRRLQAPAFPPLLIEALVALGMIGLVLGLRSAASLVSIEIDILPLAFPALASAALLAGSRSGLLVVGGFQALAWFGFLSAGGAPRGAHPGEAFDLLIALIMAYRREGHRIPALRSAPRAAAARRGAREEEQTGASHRILEQEAALRTSRQNLEAIYQASGDGLALCEAIFDEDGHVVEYQVLEVNRAHAELTAATREQMLTQRVSTIYPPIDPRWFATAEKTLKTGVMHDFDIRSRATGRWLNIRVSRVSDTLFQQTFVDISDRHRLEEQRRALLKEMSHRVMNNFQMVAGFLHIQAAAADPAARAQLQTAELRIQVLANLHSLLAYTESEGDIDAGAYVKELCSYLTASFERPDAVTLVCEVGPVRLPTDKVVPLGFVISELVSNSAKYAYPPPRSGLIRVSLMPNGEGWTLIVQDHGQGLGDAKPKEKGGLGGRLIKRFVEQIGAEITTTSGQGVRHEITYKGTAFL